ncbi:rhodanese-like domain-containing protein [Candidatus Methanocrinis natronophilus]|uniref:Rhodanese-like domain-containing protein n=1 Tax=Candidatus Methanocrinis natronophilus TaxID=3033396 RepID=A0ABT5X9R6_9EURY|nr:rhodanese-like domain-containing protein [Candidatus Methanocrinis natronophilus]MDF0591454.1 rhodanese-like domain-containing protein [Candidatus Methanocrinis natronophilus]
MKTMTRRTVSEVGPIESFALIRDRASEPDFVILDVRTAGEHDLARIEGSVHIDYLSATFEAELERLDRKKTYLLYCLVGIRSREAAKVMERLSFEEVVSMAGGIQGWHRQGLPVVGR